MLDWDECYRDGRWPWQREGLNPAFQTWLEDGRFAGKRVLIPGCGGSTEGLELAKSGADVTLLDLSDTAIAMQRKRFDEAGVSATLQVGNVLTWSAEHPFDVIYEQTCLCALEPSDRAAYVANLAHWLAPTGTLLALFMHTNREGGPPFHCPLADMRELFGDAVWRWPDSPYLHVPHSPGLFEVGVTLTRA